MAYARVLVLAGLVGALAVGTLVVSTLAEPLGPWIDIVAPNPVTQGNRGEFVVLTFPTPTNVSGWTVSDGYHVATLPSRTVDGSVAVSANPRLTELLTELPVIGWSGHLRLAASGDTVSVSDRDGSVVDRVNYPATRNGERWIRNGDDLVSDRPGRTEFAFPARHPANVTAFVFPDAPDRPHETIARAEHHVLLAGYELTDPAIRDALLERYAAGVEVQVLLDGQPVGGQSSDEAALLDTLSEAGIDVRVLTGARDRYRFHHPKYAVIDDTALIMTENWKRAGTGGASSRGWGVAVTESAFARDLETVFRTDFAGRDTVAWERYRIHADPRDTSPSRGEYPSSQAPEAAPVDSARLVVGPDATEATLRAAIRNATTRIDVQQVRISGPDFPLLVELVDAARRGVEIRIQLDSMWYVADENAYIADALHTLAVEEGLPIEVRLLEPQSSFEKIHTKGMIIDERSVVLGSMNWNNVSMRDNREIVVILEGEAAGEYYTRTFESDWTSPRTMAPVELIGIAVVAWGCAVLVARRRIDFDHPTTR